MPFRKSIQPRVVRASSSTDNSSDEGGDEKDKRGDEAHGCRILEWSIEPLMYDPEIGTPANQILTTSTTSAWPVRFADTVFGRLYVHFPNNKQNKFVKCSLGMAMPVERYERKPHGIHPSSYLFELELLPRSLHFSLLYCA